MRETKFLCILTLVILMVSQVSLAYGLDMDNSKLYSIDGLATVTVRCESLNKESTRIGCILTYIDIERRPSGNQIINCTISHNIRKVIFTFIGKNKWVAQDSGVHYIYGFSLEHISETRPLLSYWKLNTWSVPTQDCDRTLKDFVTGLPIFGCEPEFSTYSNESKYIEDVQIMCTTVTLHGMW